MSVVYTRIPRLPCEVVSAFRAVDVGAVHESMGGGSLMEPFMRSLAVGKRICGQAITALNSPGDILAMHTALTTARSGDVLVISSGSPRSNAVWGELATVYALSVGLAGVVADGAVRDVAFIRESGLPVWARTVHALRSTKQDAVGVNVPIQCGGVQVRPGDVVVADDDGVVVVPLKEVPAVLRSALRRKREEAEHKAKLAAGISLFDLAHLDQELHRLGAEVRDSVWTAGP